MTLLYYQHTMVYNLASQSVLKQRGFLKHMIKTIRGYHLVNSSPIKEAVWENVLASSLASSGIEHVWYNGGHQSGKDITIIDGVKRVGVSCKSCKDNKKHLHLSSYRMTKYHNVEDFVSCIDVERSNFEYYGILSRKENDANINYAVYFIPSKMIKASNLKWSERLNKEGTKVVSWVTDEVNGVQMSVTKSMSNQLWIKLNKEIFQDHCVVDALTIDKACLTNYALLYDMLSERNI